MPSFGDFLRTQFLVHIPKPTASFSSKTVLITGANGGLGKETAKHLIRQGASKVIFGCRSLARGKAAKAEVELAIPCKTDIIEVWEVDLESAESIKNFAERAKTLPRLDVVINNAGVQAATFRLAYDTEQSLGLNVIGTFLLAFQLLPKLQETAKNYHTTPIMTTVTSALYDSVPYPRDFGPDIFAWCRDESHVKKMTQYNLSKLLQLYILIKLAKVVDPIGTSNPNPIVINSLDPCFCKTGLAGGLTGGLKILFKMFECIAARPAEDGASLIVQAAAAGRDTHGLYFRAGEVRAYDPVVLDEQKSTYLWDLLCRKLEALQPGILENLK